MKKRIISFVFIVTSLFILIGALSYVSFRVNERIKVKGYYENNTKSNYKDNFVLKIDKINLEYLVTKSGKHYENLNDGLIFYESFNPKDKIIIFGHSGMGVGTYFNRLDELRKKDVAYLYIKDNVYVYEVYNTYLVNDNALAILKEEENSGKLLLVTCDKKDKRKRLVVELRLKSTKNP